MDLIKKVRGLFLGLAVLLMVCCGKAKKDEPQPEQKTMDSAPEMQPCLLIKVIDEGMTWGSIYGSLVYITEYFYDSNNRVIRRNFRNKSDSLTGYSTFLYNSNNKVSEEHYYNQAGVLKIKNVYSYNSDNLLISKESFKPDSLNWVFNGKFVFYYDAAGRRIRTNSFDQYQSTNLGHYFTYTYDTLKNQINVVGYIAGNQYSYLTGKLKYDKKRSADLALGYLNPMFPDFEKHNLIDYSEVQRYGMQNTWTFQYDSLGYPTQGNFSGSSYQGPNPSQPGPKTGNIYFEYDCQ